MSEKRRLPAQQAAVERWTLPDVDGPLVAAAVSHNGHNKGSAPGAHGSPQESEARGYQAGIARAQAEMQANSDALQARVRQLDSVCQLLAAPLRDLDAAVEQELLQLALAVGKQLARRELRIDPAQVIGILRESIAQLPASAREVRVHLHPEDAATVRERLPPGANEHAWTIVEDATLTRGGCLVRTESSQMDVRLESRIQAVIASAFGEERAQVRPGAQTASGES